MRIIGGTAAGLILKTPEGLGVRPTPDLVRQAIFNSLGERVAAGKFQLRLQDVFTAIPQLAGSGAEFDLIVADPPFGDKNVGCRSTSMSQRLLDDEHLPALLAPGGLFVLGHTSRDTVTLTPAWEEVKVMRHGDSMMRFLKRTHTTAVKPETAETQ